MKRRTEDVNLAIDLSNGLIPGLVGLNQDELVALLADIANRAKITTATFKRARHGLPSFSTSKWSEFAPQFGLSEDPESLELASFSTPRYRLPPSFQKMMFENAWHWQDVYRETVVQTREEAKVRILDPYIIPIVALFQGRIVDKPEQSMKGTQYSTGGEVEHEIFMIGGVLFLIIEFKLDMPGENALAQLFLALLSAAKQNNSTDFAGLRVYGLLTNVAVFRFYSYDHPTSQFCFDEEIILANKRPASFVDMVDVSNKIFGLVFSAYVNGLRATIERSKNRANSNDLTSAGSSPEEQMKKAESSSKQPLKIGKGKGGGRKSTDHWEFALAKAEACREKFTEPVTSVGDIERNGKEALALLTLSVHSIPRASTFTGGDDSLSIGEKLADLADRLVDEVYQRSLSNDSSLFVDRNWITI